MVEPLVLRGIPPPGGLGDRDLDRLEEGDLPFDRLGLRGGARQRERLHQRRRVIEEAVDQRPLPAVLLQQEVLGVGDGLHPFRR